jgi:hypothetical protein
MTEALWLLAGLAGGAAHFALLRQNMRLYLAGGNLAHALILQALRFAVTAALLGFAALHGAMSLLLAALGVALARLLVLHATAPAP